MIGLRLHNSSHEAIWAANKHVKSGCAEKLWNLKTGRTDFTDVTHETNQKIQFCLWMYSLCAMEYLRKTINYRIICGKWLFNRQKFILIYSHPPSERLKKMVLVPGHFDKSSNQNRTRQLEKCKLHQTKYKDWTKTTEAKIRSDSNPPLRHEIYIMLFNHSTRPWLHQEFKGLLTGAQSRGHEINFKSLLLLNEKPSREHWIKLPSKSGAIIDFDFQVRESRASNYKF